jgi:hypothetical protein
MKLLLVILNLFWPSIAYSQSEKDVTLEGILKQVKKNRLNDVLFDLPYGTHWLSGYYLAGKFFLCSNKSELYLSGTEEFEELTSSEEVTYIELTASVNNGGIRLIEIHNTQSEEQIGCQNVHK